MKYSRQFFQYVIIVLANAVTLIFIPIWLKDIEIQSFPAAIGICIAFIASEVVYWRLFIMVFTFLPVWLYPVFTIFLSSFIFILFCNLVPGVLVASPQSGILITAILVTINAIFASLLSLDNEISFDRNVTRKLVERVEPPADTSTPGFLFLEIDGLSEAVFRRALDENHMPTLKHWFERGSHRILSWETGFTSQTCSMQTGILMGNNENIPAYRWWDRSKKRVITAGNPWDAADLEATLSNGQGLLSNGGASRGNMFSGDADEALFTVSTMLDSSRKRGPEFYMYMTSIFIIGRLATRFLTGLLKEWWQALRQRIRNDRHMVSSRNMFYGFLRATVGPLLQELITNTVIGDILRGLPAIYAAYGEYDDLAHFAGMDTPEAFDVLSEIDRYFYRIERAVNISSRPYYCIILSDHGHSTGATFQARHGVSLEQLVKQLLQADGKIFASLNSNETWNRINAFLNESTQPPTKTAHILRTMLRSRTKNGLVSLDGSRSQKRSRRESQPKIDDARLVVLASGCTGMINFTDSTERLAYEEIQACAPELVPGLMQHPGIGFVLVRSQEFGDIVLGKEGINFLQQGTIEGIDPLGVYPEGAARSVQQMSSYACCADIVVNTLYNPSSEELCGFENQVSHHGGLGGPQNYPFLFYPAVLPVNGEALRGAPAVYHLLKGWRDTFQSPVTPVPEKISKYGAGKQPVRAEES